MIRVLVVDDQPVVLAGVRSLLSAAGGFKVVGEATNLADAKRICDGVPADVLLLDVNFPDANGLDFLPRVRKQHPDLPVIMYTAYENPRYVYRALQGGAAGYLLKSQPPERLIEFLKQAASGQGCFTREDVRRTSVALAA